MIQIEGIWWPDDVGDKWKHALMHVKSVEWAIARCKKFRTAVQAGGNVGLWPLRLSKAFDKVITFEPDAKSYAVLLRNTWEHVESWNAALGVAHTRCDVLRKSLGSHRVTEGSMVTMTTIDAQGREDLDFLQLDVEGYEWHALMGAHDTIARCKPLIQVELRDNLLSKYGKSADDIRLWLSGMGYRQVSAQQGSDFVFEAR